MKQSLTYRANNIQQSATGKACVCTLEQGNNIMIILNGMCDSISDFVAVNSAHTVVRITSQGVINAQFCAQLVEFITDGTQANYAPSSAVPHQDRVDVLMQGFNTAGQMAFKHIHIGGKGKNVPRITAKLSNPMQFSDATNPLHEVTFSVDCTKFLRNIAHLNDDSLSTQTYIADFAIIIHGVVSAEFNIASSMEINYSIQTRPMATFVRKKL